MPFAPCVKQFFVRGLPGGRMVQDLDFSGKKALVVGGSSGIGNATAQALRRRGAHVHVWGTRASASDYAQEPGSDMEGLAYEQVDVSDAEAIRKAGPMPETLDVLVLSQGMVLYDRQEFGDDGFRKVIEVNLNSIMSCCGKYFEALKNAQGAVVIISSTAAYQATRGNPAYNASKAGALGLTRTLGQAWASSGVRVNGVAPGMVATKMTKVTTGHPKRRQAMEERIPLRRLGESPEIANAVLFLASPMASYIVGQTLPVDGGLILGL
ncbi:MAG: SDR family oxidoreductase [Rubrivivax sp.]